MFFDNDHLRDLVERTKEGDDAASTQLRRELEPQMFLMVRHAFGRRRTETPLARTIVAAVRDLDPTLDVKQVGGNEPTLKYLAARLCERFVDRLGAAAGNPRDTVQRAFCTLVA